MENVCAQLDPDQRFSIQYIQSTIIRALGHMLIDKYSYLNYNFSISYFTMEGRLDNFMER